MKERKFLCKEVHTERWGLIYEPDIDKHPHKGITNGHGNNADWIEYGFLNGELTSMQSTHHAVDRGERTQFTTENKVVLGDILDELIKNNEQVNILEIGVGRSGEDSSSEVIVTKKRKDDIYVGVDNRPAHSKAYDKEDRNQFICTTDSANVDTVVSFCNDVGAGELNLIFIDGFHSVNQVLKEWEYVKLLAIGGYVGFHDTNFHPGPYCVFDAIDEKVFEKTKYCVDVENDPGIGFARRIK